MLASALHANPAWAQSSVTNAATFVPPTGFSCADVASNPSCVRNASDTDDVLVPLINVTKSAVGVAGPSVVGVYTVSYAINVTNTGAAAGIYGALTDTPVFPANTDITGISWTTSGSGAPAGGSTTGDGPYQLAAAGVSIPAGATHTFNVSITYVYTTASAPTTCAATPTPGSGLYNNASLPAGQEPVTSDNSACVNPPAVPVAALTIDKTAGVPSGGSAGSTIPYTFVITNTGAVTLTGIAVVDARLDAPATCASTTLTPTAPGNTTTCTGVHTITAAEVALGSVGNSATATGSTSGGIAVASPPDTTLTTLIPTVNFCAADSVFNVTQTTDGLRGQFYRYAVGSGTPDVLLPGLTLDVPSNLNALMVDPVNNRLLFISYAGGRSTLYAYDPANPAHLPNSGWYVAAGPIATPDFPRAGMTQAGVGYLVAGNGATPAVWRVTPSGPFNYSLASYGTLSYDFAPTDTSSGDIAFDAGGSGWLTAGVDLYKLDFSTSLVRATRQQRPLLNGAPSTVQWAGVAYGNDGLLYLATNSNPSAYYRIDLRTSTLARVAATAANQARDLASCSFPAVSTPAQLRVQKTLALVNGAAYVAGAAVSAGDRLTYRIAVTHVGGTLAATLFPGEVVEALPANTSVVATGNDFTCTGSNCTNTNAVNIPVGGNTALNFVVQVATPFPTGATASIINAVTVSDVDCAATTNDCRETTGVALPALSLDKTSGSTGYSAVGNTLSYSYLVTNTGNTTITSPIAVSDDRIVSPAVVACPALPTGGLAPTQSITCTASHVVTQADLDAGSVTNIATASDGATTSPSDTVTINAIVTPAWTVAKSSADSAYSAVGDVLDYTYLVTNTGNVSISAIVIADDRTTDEACPAAMLAAGASMTCTATYTVTQADLDAGSVTNTVTMTGTPTSGTLPPAIDDLTINATAAPAWNVVKSSTDTTFSAVGDVLDYSYLVTNTGNVSIGAIVIADDRTTNEACPAATLAAGAGMTCTATYTVTQADLDAGSVTNTVTMTGTPTGGTLPPALDELTINATAAPAWTVVKTSTDATFAAVGDVLDYSYLVTNTGNVSISAIVIADDRTTNEACPAAILAAGTSMTCTATYTVIQSDLDAGSVTNTVTMTGTPSSGTLPPATDDLTIDAAAAPALTLLKTAGAPSGNTAGSTIAYTFTVTNTGNVTLNGIAVIDALLDAPAVCPPTALPPGAIATCTGTHTITQADLTAGVVSNTATAAGTPPSGPPVSSDPSTTTSPLLSLTVSKASNPASGETVQPGQTLTYTLTALVANAATTSVLTLTDTMSGDQTLTGPLPANCASSAGGLVCSLPAGTQPGSYDFTYTTTVDADATGRLGNNVVPAGNDNPSCSDCSTEHPVAASVVTVAKTSNPASGAEVAPGDVLAYTLTLVVANSITTDAVILTDTISGDQLITGALPAGCAANATGLVCTLPAGALPGSYSFAYSTRVAADATGTLGNVVVPSGGDGPTCVSCSTSHEIVATVVTVSKTSNPASGSSVSAGDMLSYTLTVTVANSVTTDAVTLTDTISGDQTFTGALPAGCATRANGLLCTLAAGTLPGTYTFAYSTLVDTDAAGTLGNVVVAAGGDSPTCAGACSTEHPVLSDYQLRILKTAAVREVKIGDLVRYTLSVENVGTGRLIDGSIVDTPPLGFSYVEGSLSAVDGDNQATAVGQSPLRFEGLDIEPGQTATLVYAMRVGAGVRPGVQVNQAQAFSRTGSSISNTSTAAVTLVADALVDDSLLIGTVFDDRDGDTWQDSAALSAVRVQGGFAPDAYVANSTTVDRGAGPQPQADASSPLLHGIALGDITPRQSVADPVANHQVVIRQRLNQPAFTDDFVLTSAQGVTVRMDASGATTVEKSGEAAKGLNAAEPTVERRVSQGEDGYVVDYVIGNLGIDERGIPGVRIASVEGLLIETDQFGRYHLEGVHGGDLARGRNFILKVDPSTLPKGASFTTDNPLVRRITPGVPVRFDFGVSLPVEEVQGGEQQVELELGEVVFAPGSAELREQYAPVIERMAAKVVEYHGGEVLISATGDSPALAFGRADAVRTALLGSVPAGIATALTISVRTEIDEPSTLLVGIAEGGPLLGTVLFDTDKATVRSQYLPILEQIAAYLEKKGGGEIAIVGHADPRGADAYNTALGMRRAQAVFAAIAARLSPEVRARVRVESSNDPAAPAGNSK